MAARKVIIDTDPAIGSAFRDVDDALAMLYLLALPEEFEVVGVTPVFGNAPLAKTTLKAEEVLRVAGRPDLPVHPGASSKRELGKPSAASEFLAATVSENPGAVTVLAIGPLTNVATAGLVHDGFYGQVESIVVMGGALEAGYGLPFVSPLEFNFMKDIAAARALLDAPCRKVIVTMDVCTQVVFTRRELDAILSMSNPAAGYLSRYVKPWLRLNALAPTPWKGGFVPWDVIAAVYLRRPGLFEEAEVGLRLRPGRFMTGGLERLDGAARPCVLPETVRAPELLDEFLDAIYSYRTATTGV